ncbi:MAG TPA: DUF4388 domain-containing protein [Ktedonobacterales bacterium]|nr:DUF4388 domain-containing protein [Ktedonobacterales bacterium]
MQAMDFLAHQIAQGHNYHPMSEQTTIVVVETRPHIASLIKEALEDSRLVVALANTIDDVQVALSRRRGFALLLVNVGAISSQSFSPQTRFGPSGALGTLQRISNGQPLWQEIGGHASLQRVPMICFSSDGMGGPPGTITVKSPQDFQLLAQRVINYLNPLAENPMLRQLLDEDCLPSLKGSVEEVPLADLFQLFKLGGHSGILLLRESGRLAVMGLVDGEVVHVFAEGASGREAIYLLFNWKAAQFAFYKDLTLPERTVNVSTEHLVLEASRRGDESLEMRNKIPSLRTLIYRAPRLTDTLSTMQLPMAEWRVLSVIGRRNTVGDIIKLSGMSEFNALKMLDSLLTRGLVMVGEEAVSKNTGSLSDTARAMLPRTASQ